MCFNGSVWSEFQVNPMSTEEGVAEGTGLTQRPTTLQWGGPNGVCTNMGSPGPLGSLTPSPATRSKIEQLKQWSLSTYKCTRQILAEKMGKVSVAPRSAEILISQWILMTSGHMFVSSIGIQLYGDVQDVSLYSITIIVKQLPLFLITRGHGQWMVNWRQISSCSVKPTRSTWIYFDWQNFSPPTFITQWRHRRPSANVSLISLRKVPNCNRNSYIMQKHKKTFQRTARRYWVSGIYISDDSVLEILLKSFQCTGSIPCL